MKMNYDPSISRRSRRFPVSTKIILAIASILIVLYFLAPQALSSFFTMLVRPFWSIDAEDQEIAELRRKLHENESKYAQALHLVKENEELKELLGRTDESEKVLAVVLKKPPLSAYDVFVLDVGDSHGIKKGNRVYALGSIPIGEIAEVNGNTSKARLYSSSGEKFDILIGDENIQASAIGKGGGTFEVSLPHETEVEKGDKVMIPSLSNGFVGHVEEIVSEPSHPFSTMLFRQPINMYEQKWVMVEITK